MSTENVFFQEMSINQIKVFHFDYEQTLKVALPLE